MTIEQIQDLSNLTEIASSMNDIESLKNIYEIIKKDNLITKPENIDNEWFWSLLTSQQANQI